MKSRTAPRGWVIASLGLPLCLFGAQNTSQVEGQTAARPAAVTVGATAAGAALEFSTEPTVEELYHAAIIGEPLVPIGGNPGLSENAQLAAALRGYSHRSGPDDFSSLTGFLEAHPHSPWVPALLTGLGIEYYNTAHYSLALDVWSRAWTHSNEVTDAKGKAVMDRAVSELAHLYCRLGRMAEMEALLKSIEGRTFIGPARQTMSAVHEALWTMQNHPEIAFRCGPMALHRIQLASDPQHVQLDLIHHSASTLKGFSLPQVAELSRQLGMNYQMAFREKGAPLLVPSVIHWKVGHYAAIVRQVGDRFLVEDPTFGNSVWPTQQALDAEASGYFLVPPGKLPPGWRAVDVKEGEQVWGKGLTGANDPGIYACHDMQTATCGTRGVCYGMAASTVHFMICNLQAKDTPVGYAPPVGPPVWFTVRYNHRDQPPGQFFGTIYNLLGEACTHDWRAFIVDSPQSPLADVKYYIGGGGIRTFTGFDTNTQSFAHQLYDQTLLHRTGTNSYELLEPDGSKKIFDLPQNFPSSTRTVWMTRLEDPSGNAVTLTYNTNFDLIALTDALGQVTTLSYTPYLQPPFANTNYTAWTGFLTNVTDPFGRSASFQYTVYNPGTTNVFVALTKITDCLGLVSQFEYDSNSGIMRRMTTPYGVTSFTTDPGNSNIRFVETTFPDGSRERVEYNQTISNTPADPPSTVPVGMQTDNAFLNYRDTYYWNRNACATAYGDYTRATIFHWCHTADLSTTSGVLESIKKPLENRVWYDYPGQLGSYVVGASSRPAHIGRVLDDGSTQLYTYAYNGFGHVTNMIDPVARTLSFIYDTNGVDLLEVRQTRANNNELLARRSYNGQHRPMTIIDAAGQTNRFTYNARGQVLSATDPKSDLTTYSYDTNGYLIAVDGPLPGTNDLIGATYDNYGRLRTVTDVGGYVLTFDYDVMDRPLRISYPDGTYVQYSYDLLNLASIQDRAGRVTLLDHDKMRQIVRKVDPLGRVTLYEWCSCGLLKSMTDPMGRQTSWLTDLEGRTVTKRYADGSQLNYFYENTTSRLQQFVDPKLQSTSFDYNPDNTIKALAFANAPVPTAPVTFSYDPDYQRITAVSDGSGTTVYSYIPIGTNTPVVGAGRLASVNGPLPNQTVTYGYDELGRAVHRTLNGADLALAFDPAGRLSAVTNGLGAFSYGYDGGSGRLISAAFPNGLAESVVFGSPLQDFAIQQISFGVGATPVSEFDYGVDNARSQITTWSQQGANNPASIYTFGYDPARQLLSAVVTNGGVLANSFAYTYDPAGNRLSEQVGATNFNATYNPLNELSTSSAPGASRTNQWDAMHRLVAVDRGNQRTEFTYDPQNRVIGIRQLVNGGETARRIFVWEGSRLREERDTNGVVITRFFAQGVQVLTGTNAGNYYYTRDHLGSVRELVDNGGNVRARYSYDPFGRRTRLSGDMDTDFGFAGMFWSPEAQLALTRFRPYDPELGRWLSRDPLRDAEARVGPNLYTYVGNEPISRSDPLGLATTPGMGSFGRGFNTVSTTCLGSPQGVALCGALARELGEAEQALAPTAEAAAGEIQSCAAELPSLLDRVQSVGSRAQGAYQQLQAYFEEPSSSANVMKLGVDYVNEFGQEVWAFTYFIPPEEWLEFEQDLSALVMELATKFNVDPNWVRQSLLSAFGLPGGL